MGLFYPMSVIFFAKSVFGRGVLTSQIEEPQKISGRSTRPRAGDESLRPCGEKRGISYHNTTVQLMFCS